MREDIANKINEINEYMDKPRRLMVRRDNPRNKDILNIYLINVGEHLFNLPKDILEREVLLTVNNRHRVIENITNSLQIVSECRGIEKLYINKRHFNLEDILNLNLKAYKNRLKLQLWSLINIGYLMKFKCVKEGKYEVTEDLILDELNEVLNYMKWRFKDEQ